MSILSLLVVLFVVCGVWIGLLKRSLKKLSCTRAFSKTVVTEGDEGELVEVVRNDSPCTIPWLRLESRTSPHLQLGRQSNVRISGEQFYTSLFTLMPYQQVRRRHKVRFLRRGAYDLGSASLTSGDLLGIYHFQRLHQESAPVLVYPRLLDPEDVPAPLSRMMGDFISRRHLLQDPFLVRGIRPYQPGDPVRDIHWMATARTAETQVLVRDYTVETRLLVVLNVQNEDQQWGNHMPEQHLQAMEDAIRLAATLCVQALREGLHAGFAANMPLGDSRQSVCLLPAGGSAQEEELLSAFARLNVVRTENILPILSSLEACQGLDILLLSRYESESLRTALDKLTAAGNRTYLYPWGGEEV